MNIPFDNSYARLGPSFSAPQMPTPVAAPALIAVNGDLAAELGLDAAALRTPEGLAMLAGNTVPDGATPLAQAYAGHQFGGFSPQLGDGRAVLLGEVIDQHGNRRDIQLKGAGRTPFSRRGDGRSWLGPVLREYIVSEAMHAYGVPTTRALAAVSTGERVQREKGYPGGILTRVAASHIRVGTFQFFAARNDGESLRTLTDYVIKRHYPDGDGPMELLRAVSAAQARLIAQWMGLGFIHGVMNTDNMAVSGETIDYGPCAFMDDYDPNKVFSSIDQMGRYAFNRQADIAVWNIAQLGSALLPIMGRDEQAAIDEATAILHGFPDLFKAEWLSVFRPKLGLWDAQDGDAELIHGFLDLMSAGAADYTNSFRALTDDPAQSLFADRAGFDAWKTRWKARLQGADPAPLMQQHNPVLIPRNHQIEHLIQAAVDGDYAPFHRLNAALMHPYADDPGLKDLRQPPREDEVVHRTFCGT